MVKTTSFDNFVAIQSRPMLLGTLVRLRWFALVGQTIAVLVVTFGLNYPMPTLHTLILISISAMFNVGLVLRFGISHRPATALAATQLAFDALQLAGLLWLTGGLQNPFSLLLLAPVSVSATILPQRETALVGALTILIATLLSRSHLPLPWNPDAPLNLPDFYIVGVWVALICGIVFVTIYANRVAHEGRQLADALSATELALSRQQHLSALDGLAAAAAHELGTPLSTITLAAKEMLGEVDEGPIAQDVQLIVEQAARCRVILSRLRNLDSEGEDLFAAVPVSEMLEELARPFAHLDKSIRIELNKGGSDQSIAEPVIVRSAGLLHGLGNLIENAVQFSRNEVLITADWDGEILNISIRDDGSGFAPDLLPRLGEPYLRTSSIGRDVRGPETAGLGLGIFIAKTLLMRSGATIDFANYHGNEHAQVNLRWLRTTLQKQIN